jgi:hypothetical protein
VAEIVDPLAEQLRGDVRRWIRAQLDDPQQRLAGASRAVQWLDAHLKSIGQDTRRIRRGLADQLVELCPWCHSTEQASAAALPVAGGAGRVKNYFQLRLDQVALDAVDYVGRVLGSELKSIGDDLITFGRELNQMASVAANCNGGEAAGAACATGEFGATVKVRSRLSELVTRVDTQLQSEYLDHQGGLYETVMQGGRPRAQLGAKMQEIARQVVSQAVVNFDVIGPDLTTSSASENQSGLQASVEAATPLLLEFGGARRVLAMLPATAMRQIDAGQISAAAGTDVSLVVGGDCGLTICVEAEQLPLVDIAVEIVQRRRDSVEFAKRVHTRSDINWMPLLTPPPVEESPRYQRITTLPLTTDHYVRQTEVL